MVEIVVKVGGALLAHSDAFDAVLETIDAAGRDRRLLVVPGGGPFAGAVRDVDQRFQLADETAGGGRPGWINTRISSPTGWLWRTRGDRAAIGAALTTRDTSPCPPRCVVAQSRSAPSFMDVTSDNIAAWVRDI
jgi:aspartokinase-like uncharacterized kinase